MRLDSAPVRRPNVRGWAALVVVYVVWGSTYLAIRVGVRDLPPLTMAGVRYLAAGVLLYPIAIRTGGPIERGTDKPGRRQWLGATIVGLLLLVFGNGGLSIGERSLDSGYAAVVVATVPLWMVLLAWPIDRTRPTRRSLIALAIGLVGVAALAGASSSAHLASLAVVLGASAAWGLGSVLAHHLVLPRRALVAAAAEMIAGGALLLIAAAIHGDPSRIHWSQVPASAWLALVYLIGPGSVLAFTAYGYALSHLPLATVSTYAYVNPVVAVLLGVTILGEPLTVVELIGIGLVITSVMLTLRRRTRPTRSKCKDPPELPETAGSRLGTDAAGADRSTDLRESAQS
jgi:drug/metabolite transporter (DMT)-like permease